MSAISTWTFVTEELENFCNQVKDVLLHDLAKSGIIPHDQVEELGRTKMVVIKKRSKISQSFRKIVGKDDATCILIGTIKLEERDGEKEQGTDQDEGEAEETSEENQEV